MLESLQVNGAARRRVVIWSPNYAPEIMGIPPLVTEASEWLSERGHAVRVVTAVPNYPARTVFPEYRGRLWMSERRGGVDVHRSWLRVRPEETFRDKVLYEATFAGASFPAIASHLSASDVCVCVIPSLAAGLIAAFWTGLRARLGRTTPLVFWLQDVVLEAASAVNGAGERREQLLRAVGRLESAALRSATRIVVCSPGFVRHVLSAGVSADRLHIVPNWVDVDRYAIDADTTLDTPVRFLYAGNLGYTQGFETLISAARSLGSGITLRIVGAGNASSHVRELAEPIPSVRVESPVPASAVPRMLANADVQVLVQRGVSADANFPSKIGPYLASGRPIIASIGEGCAAAGFLRESGAAILVPPDDPIALAAGMAVLRDDQSLRCELGRRGREFARARLSTAVCLPKLEEAFLG